MGALTIRLGCFFFFFFWGGGGVFLYMYNYKGIMTSIYSDPIFGQCSLQRVSWRGRSEHQRARGSFGGKKVVGR